jgi:EAL domain-containing protein (putative c-di-GMP-specific phosphodiesterase class I)
VDTEAQKRFLMAAGCRQAQGYYFSRPVPAARASEILRRGVIGDDTVATAASKYSAA